MEKPELLMPAGSLEKMEYALAYGADAVYLGAPHFSLRARENAFDLESLQNARDLTTRLGKKMYLTTNIFAKNRKLKPFSNQIEDWVQLKPDAFIMSDPGFMMIARERYPDINIHLSVQANCLNWQSVKFWKESLGVSRIILSRELHINEIKEIKQRVPEVELEVFVHGSICIAYSGRCLMSSYMSHRDANQGVCDNSCREKFKLHSSNVSLKNGEFFLEDMRAEGSLYELSEDEHGTYMMNAKDLRLIHHLKEIYDAGVC
ncbi:MAG: U32 family peptidase [Bdellovibrionaceae bacterium]|nr:U32 family peptidase [Pseudobdellovibrionaceae bacterium]